MPKYAYKAMNKEGKEQFGVIEAESQALAINDVRSLGLYPTQIREARKSDERRARRRKKTFNEFYIGGLKTKQIVIMTRQLATLIDAGLPVVRFAARGRNLQTALSATAHPLSAYAEGLL